ncbi:MAG: hypothetical protein SGJ19_02140 [Planctomycetia bacterium]|nr:hypothetical protein [Planctomycetia bacterium]
MAAELPPEGLYLTPAQLAHRWRTNTSKVIRFIATGELRAINMATNRSGSRPRWRITPQAVETFELSRTSGPVSPAPRRVRPRSFGSVPSRY